MMTYKAITKSGLYLAALLIFAACSDDDEAQSIPAPTQAQMIQQMIDEVRDVTSAFHDFEAGVQAGWSVPLSGCVAHPELGGMGYHYGRMEYFDGRTNHLEPQVLLYEPKGDGEMEFVGVEYIIPFEILSEDADPPTLFYQEYHKNHIQEIWALHVWTERENPEGMFFDWNPNVSCE